MPVSAHPLLRRRVLVTGGSGFIGRWLLRRLTQCGAEVSAVCRTPPPRPERNERWLRADLASPGEARRVLAEARPDLVYHLASHVAGSRTIELVEPTFLANLASTVHLLVAATELGIGRIVLAGSLEEPTSGDGLAVPASPYAASKWGASGYARMFRTLYQTPVVIARIFMVYGPGPQDEKKLVPYVLQSLLASRPPALSSGNREVDWIYVEDVARGLVCLGHAPGIEGETVDLGSGELTRIREVVGILSRQIDPAVPLDFGAVPDRPLEQIRAADAGATRARIGFGTEITLEEGLRRTVDWFRARPQD